MDGGFCALYLRVCLLVDIYLANEIRAFRYVSNYNATNHDLGKYLEGRRVQQSVLVPVVVAHTRTVWCCHERITYLMLCLCIMPVVAAHSLRWFLSRHIAVSARKRDKGQHSLPARNNRLRREVHLEI